MKKIISTEHAPAAIGAYSQAVQAGNTLYISGQIPIDPHTGQMIEENITKQTELVMKNIGVILKEAGYSYGDVVKSTVLLSDMNNFKAVNDIYGNFYLDNPPARAAYGVTSLPLNSLIEIETIAYKEK